MVFRGWAKSSTCCFYICLSCAILCQMSSRLVRLSNVDLSCPGPLPSSDLSSPVCDLCFSLTQMFAFPSRYVLFNIRLSIFVCAAASLFFVWVVSAHVSAPYVICFVKQVPMLPIYMSQCLANAVRPAMILL